jgi:hypothetical protein
MKRACMVRFTLCGANQAAKIVRLDLCCESRQRPTKRAPTNCVTRCDMHAGLRKETFKKWVRQLGTLCAVCQLGTAFAAIRALFSSEARQRLVEMDLRSAM